VLADPAAGAPLVEHALAEVTGALDGDVPAVLTEPIRRCGGVLASRPVALTWSLDPYAFEPAEGTVDRSRARALAALEDSADD
jgi:hypothetical protein